MGSSGAGAVAVGEAIVAGASFKGSAGSARLIAQTLVDVEGEVERNCPSRD
jgi:hypothetical protein